MSDTRLDLLNWSKVTKFTMVYKHSIKSDFSIVLVS